MKILVVSNLYPPHHIGGYELGCRDVVEKLRARGHAVTVLTSNFRQHDRPGAETDVHRTLHFAAGGEAQPHQVRAECARLTAILREVKPEAVYFWNLGGLCRWLPIAARWQGLPAAFFLSDTNFISWRVGAWLGRAAKKFPPVAALFGRTFLVRGWPVIRHQPCHFASDFLRGVAEKNGIAPAGENSIVAHWGIDLAQFAVTPRERWPVRRLLYAGQMIPQKGVHTAITAFAQLVRETEFAGLTFSLAGGGQHPDYERTLRELAAQTGVADRVRFLGKVPRAELPGVYAEHDVLVFPSEWDEPFAITPLEAMHCGLAVVGTTTGGSGELFRDRETALTFRAGDAADCARALREVCSDRELFDKISTHGQRAVRAQHTLDAMVDKIEASLIKIIKP